MSCISRVLMASFTGFALLLSAGCGDRDQQVAQELDAVNQQLMAALVAGDGAAIAALYTEDAQLLPPNSPVIPGRAGIAAFWQGAIGGGVKGISLKATEVQGHGDTAHEVGNYRLTGPAGREIEAGKYIVVWKKVEGQWRLHRDIWNMNKNP